jgi:tetratricopeptide (TPR) repeat protein
MDKCWCSFPTVRDLIKREFLSQKVDDWEECKQLVPHMDTFYPGQPGDKSFDRWVSLTMDVRALLYEKGRYDEAVILYRRALEWHEKELGVRHPHTLTSVSNLALVFWDQGKYEEAEKLNRRALEGYEKELGVRHPHTLSSVYCLADLLHTTKRHAEATELYQCAYDGYVQTLGPQHPHTIACGNRFLALQQEKY